MSVLVVKYNNGWDVVGMEIDMTIHWKSKSRWSPIEVAEKMSAHVAHVAPECLVREVAEIMRDENVGCIPVVSGNQLTGMITDRDIACRMVAERRNPDETFARDIMTRQVYTCRPDELLADAAKIMEDHQVRRLPVVDEGGKDPAPRKCRHGSESG